MSSSVWNILSPIKTGVIKLAGSGNQLFGTVVQHGVNPKTVIVRVTAQNWNNKYQLWLYSNKNKQVHDEYNYCVTGDKVIIKSCLKLSKSKAYYVKTIVKPFSRDQHYTQMRGSMDSQRRRRQQQQILERQITQEIPKVNNLS